MKRIGLFGGTFNPIHFGHLNLAIELMERKALDEVWLIPALSSPFRVSEEEISSFHRLQMLNLACADIPQFLVKDLELKRPSPSYTVETIQEIIQNKQEGERFFLLLGQDSLLRFAEWKQPDRLVQLVSLIIGCRPGAEDLISRLCSLNLSREICDAIHEGMVITPMMEISATYIRERLKKKLYCGHLVPVKVLDYIYENQLYFKF